VDLVAAQQIKQRLAAAGALRGEQHAPVEAGEKLFSAAVGWVLRPSMARGWRRTGVSNDRRGSLCVRLFEAFRRTPEMRRCPS